jgi:hypothetical protein
MIVGEVKEGAARLNDAMQNPIVIEIALTRFGCCAAEHAAALTNQLLAHGRVTSATGHSIRMVAFGNASNADRPGPWSTVPMGHVVRFLRGYLRRHWKVLRHAQIKEPTLAVLALIEKWSVETKEEANGSVRVQRRT